MDGALGFPGLSRYGKETHSREERQNIQNALGIGFDLIF